MFNMMKIVHQIASFKGYGMGITLFVLVSPCFRENLVRHVNATRSYLHFRQN